jgi:hypothetical protein
MYAPSRRFSSTVIKGKTFRPWGTYVIPRWSSAAGGWFVMSSPANRTEPSRAGRSPNSVRKTVDLPAPLGPMMETIWPGSTRSDTPRRISIFP